MTENVTATVTETLKIDADLAEIRSLGPWLADLLVAAGASESHGPLELALHEICVNVVTHAYESGPGTISIQCRCDAERIELEVRDHGHKEFDATQFAEPVPGVPQIHGYGLMIVRQLVDELSYSREEGTNIWLLRTKR